MMTVSRGYRIINFSLYQYNLLIVHYTVTQCLVVCTVFTFLCFALVLAVKFQTAAVTVKEGSFVDLMGETSESPFVVPFDIGVICFPIRASGIKSGKAMGIFAYLASY